MRGLRETYSSTVAVDDASFLGAAGRAMSAAANGDFPPAAALGWVLVGHAAIFGYLAVRWFRW